jgi:hypothetical protein
VLGVSFAYSLFNFRRTQYLICRHLILFSAGHMPHFLQALLRVTFGVQPQSIAALKTFKCEGICQFGLLSNAMATRYSTASFRSSFSVSPEQRQRLISRIAVLPSDSAILYLDVHCFLCNPFNTAVTVTCRGLGGGGTPIL